VFQNKNGWLVAAPFEYNGETITDNDIATRLLVADSDIPGTYQILIHKYKMDYANMEEVTPVEITLTADGKVTGAYSGTWSLQEGTSYLTIKLGTVTYNGVLFEEQIDGKTITTVSFSAMANSGVNVWGYKYRPDYALAWHLNNMGNVPVTNGANITRNYDLYNITPTDQNVMLQWTTSEPNIISEYGTYYPVGLEEDTPVELTARMTAANYFWQQTYKVTARSEANSQHSNTSWQDNMVARYKFDDAELTNSLNASEKAQLLRKSTTKVPAVENGDPLRNGGLVHTAFGANGKESYVAIPNPLKGRELTDGATISFYVKRTDNNLWDALFGMSGTTGRLYMTGNLYLGFNDGVTADEASGIYNNWLDVNHPDKGENADLGTDRWHLVTVTFQRTVASTTGGIIIYVDGKKHTDKYNGKYAGNTVTSKTGFKKEGYGQIVDFLASCDELYLGMGSFWGSADARFDELIVHDRYLSTIEIGALYQMTNRSETSQTTLSIEQLAERTAPAVNDNVVYDLMGRKVETLTPGLYIKNGKKFIVR
jgi:arabinan endo-1,5-alpha-L-arabinosidase